jgi:hypothetical protein
MTLHQEFLFGIPLSTYRDKNVEHAPFPYEMIIAALAIGFFRTTMHPKKDPFRWVFGFLLGYMTYQNMPYEFIAAAEILSFAIPLCLFYNGEKKDGPGLSLRLALIAVSGGLSFAVCHFGATGDLFRWMKLLTPYFVKDALAVLFPVDEVQAAYDIVDRFILEPGLLKHQVSRLFFTTLHLQCGIGYIGIDFLTAEQERRNQLVRMDMNEKKDVSQNGSTGTMNKKTKASMMEKSRKFQTSAAPFIFFVAVPYMLKIIAFGNLNAFAFACFKNDVHQAVRLHDLFAHENNLVAMATHSAKSPADYGDYMNVVVSTTYDLFNRKMFSLPKVMLLPMIMMRQPKMVAQIFPIIFVTDWMKGRVVAYMTNRIEHLEKERQQLVSMRSKVESFDIKNAELLQRAGE